MGNTEGTEDPAYEIHGWPLPKSPFPTKVVGTSEVIHGVGGRMGQVVLGPDLQEHFISFHKIHIYSRGPVPSANHPDLPTQKEFQETIRKLTHHLWDIIRVSRRRKGVPDYEFTRILNGFHPTWKHQWVGITYLGLEVTLTAVVATRGLTGDDYKEGHNLIKGENHAL